MLEFIHSSSLSFFEIIRIMLALMCFTSAVSYGWMLGKDVYCSLDQFWQSKRNQRKEPPT